MPLVRPLVDAVLAKYGRIDILVNNASAQGMDVLITIFGTPGWAAVAGPSCNGLPDPAELADAWERCRSEAQAAFGHGGVYAEELMARARHVEVQVLGDGRGGVVTLGDRVRITETRPVKQVIYDLVQEYIDTVDRLQQLTHGTAS